MKLKKIVLTAAAVAVMAALLTVPALAETGTSAAEILQEGFEEIEIDMGIVITNIIITVLGIIGLVLIVRWVIRWFKELMTKAY